MYFTKNPKLDNFGTLQTTMNKDSQNRMFNFSNLNTKQPQMDMFSQKHFHMSSAIHNGNYPYSNLPQNYAQNLNTFNQRSPNSSDLMNCNLNFKKESGSFLLNNTLMSQPQVMTAPNPVTPYSKENNYFVPIRNGQPMVYMRPDGNMFQYIHSPSLQESMMQHGDRKGSLSYNVVPESTYNMHLGQPDQRAISNTPILNVPLPQPGKMGMSYDSFRMNEVKQSRFNAKAIQMYTPLDNRTPSEPLNYTSDVKANFKLPALRCKLGDDSKFSLNLNSLPSLNNLKQEVNGPSADSRAATLAKEKNTKSLINKKPNSRPLKFPCTKCEKKFHRQDALQTHMNIHLGLKPYKCIHCDKCFNAKQNMVRHRKRHEE